jgi:hypothetical protein
MQGKGSRFILSHRPAIDAEVEEAKKREDAFIKKYGDRISCSLVHGRIWIGDMGAAIGVATGTLRQFSSVVNASGSELIDGVSMANIASRYQSSAIHKSVWDQRGMVMSDQPFDTVENVVEQRIASGETLGPKKSFVSNGVLYKTYGATQMTKTIFYTLVMQAAAKIQHLMEKSDGDILVHCYAGLNRSAACIAAYLMVFNEITYANTISILSDALSKRGLPIVLTNKDFRTALSTMPNSIHDADERANDEIVRVRRLLEKGSTNTVVGDEIEPICFSHGCKNHAMYLCHTCKTAMYCSRMCQTVHWLVDHKKNCTGQKN